MKHCPPPPSPSTADLKTSTPEMLVPGPDPLGTETRRNRRTDTGNHLGQARPAAPRAALHWRSSAVASAGWVARRAAWRPATDARVRCAAEPWCALSANRIAYLA